MQDIVIDPGHKHMVALDFTPRDLEYMARHPILIGRRLHLAGIPMRVKTRVLWLGGLHKDIVADRTHGDWIALEVTPDDLSRLVGMNIGQDTRKIVYAGQKGRNDVQAKDIEQFKSNWPELHSPDENMDYARGMPMSIAKSSMANEFKRWANDWPLNFHATEKAPAPRLVLADGKVSEGKDG
jgi:hypothetical protein